MVETVVIARHSAQAESTVIVVPLQQLNDRHLSMRRMVSGGNMLWNERFTSQPKTAA